jgi:hypothetical protein
MCRPCADPIDRGIIRRDLLPSEEGHALRSVGDEVERQKTRSTCLRLICIVTPCHVKAVIRLGNSHAIRCSNGESDASRLSV